MREFLRKKDVIISPRRYFVDAMSAMTLGLFASLIMGTIFREIGVQANIGFLDEMGRLAQGATGYAIGIGVAWGLKAPPLVLFACAAVGFMGNSLGIEIGGVMYTGGPAGAFFAALVACEAGKLVSKSTKLDIIATPAVTLLVGYGVARLVSPPIGAGMYQIGQFIMRTTEIAPLPMGVIVAVVMGMILTAPISSAAIAISLGLEGIAAGAAVAGCAANMVGFAVISYRENKISGLLSQGLGTSMLQLPNIMKNPRIWTGPIAASAVGGAVSAAVFAMENNPVGAGMGTSGLVGPFNAFAVMGFGALQLVQVLLVFFVIPAIISLPVTWLLRNRGWIKPGDMALEI